MIIIAKFYQESKVPSGHLSIQCVLYRDFGTQHDAYKTHLHVSTYMLINIRRGFQPFGKSLELALPGHVALTPTQGQGRSWRGQESSVGLLVPWLPAVSALLYPRPSTPQRRPLPLEARRAGTVESDAL